MKAADEMASIWCDEARAYLTATPNFTPGMTLRQAAAMRGTSAKQALAYLDRRTALKAAGVTEAPAATESLLL
jgi:hypothetical protein